MIYDLRFALRGLLRDRAFVATAVAMLALAIGLNTAMFVVMNAMLFRGFPLVQRNNRVVYLQEHPSTGGCCMSYPDFEDWRTQAQSFSGMAFIGGSPIRFRDRENRPSDLAVFKVSSNLFSLLGVRPALGRDFSPADEIPGAPQVVILNDRFWTSRFGKRADVVGMRVQVDDMPATIIGVMPERFDFPTQQDMWMPLKPDAALRKRGLTPGGFTVIARLRDGVSVRQARSEMQTMEGRLQTAFPATNRNLSVSVIDDLHFHTGPNGTVVYGTLFAGALFLLLIACANVANLALARTIGRERELLTRIALGAGQGRMARQVFLESAALVGIAAAIAWQITRWSIHAWAQATASRFQIVDYTIDSTTFAYLSTISLVAVIFFSMAPVIRIRQLGVESFRRDLQPGPRAKRMATALVAVQMTLALVLLSGTGMLVRSLLNVVGAKTGVREPERILAGSVRLPSDKYPIAASRAAYFERLERRLKTIPGATLSSIANRLPAGGGGVRGVEFDGIGNEPPSVQVLTVGANYFALMSGPVSGREFNDGDSATAAPVAIVNESFAAKFWPREQAIGKRLRVSGSPHWRTVIGIAPNIMQGDAIRQHFLPVVYLPLQQEPPVRAFFLLRTVADVDGVARAARMAVEGIDRDADQEPLTTVKASFAFDGDYMDVEHMELGKYASIAPIFGMIALLLAATGLYAVIAHRTGRRTREIGVRMALGANMADIRELIFREGIWPVLGSIAIGSVASLAVNWVLESQLVGLSPYDPAVMAAAPAVLLAVALVANYVPARRAMRVDPAIALRHD